LRGFFAASRSLLPHFRSLFAHGGLLFAHFPLTFSWQGENKSEVLYETLTDVSLKDVIKEQIKPMNERCQLAHEEIYDKVEVEEALRRTVAEVRSRDLAPCYLGQLVTLPAPIHKLLCCV